MTPPLPQRMREAAKVIEQLNAMSGLGLNCSASPIWLRREADRMTTEQPEEKPACKGFQWVGQSFSSCDGCGKPFWEHEFDTRMQDGAGPFDDEPFKYVPISDEQKAACRAKWEGR